MHRTTAAVVALAVFGAHQRPSGAAQRPAQQAEEEPLSVEPAVWNYGVRPRERLITTTVRLRPREGSRVRVGLIQIACSCLAAEVLRGEGTPEEPAEIRVPMDTERFSGRTRHVLFVNMVEPEKRLDQDRTSPPATPSPALQGRLPGRLGGAKRRTVLIERLVVPAKRGNSPSEDPVEGRGRRDSGTAGGKDGWRHRAPLPSQRNCGG